MEKNKILKGRIHSFETFGAVDGPGIRFVLFMQGCPLQCKYCQNRDTWDMNSGQEYSSDEILNKILRTKPYMDSSNGGVTVSGGEPLIQSKFLIELFKKLKGNHIHTALDTSGVVKINKDIIDLLSLTDLVILDIKHINAEKCKELTGHSNKEELNLAKYCSDNGIDLWIRQVLVPGITDREEDLVKTREFIKTLKTVKNVEILPYHNLGQFKWEELGQKYPLAGLKPPDIAEIEKANKIIKAKKEN